MKNKKTTVMILTTLLIVLTIGISYAFIMQTLTGTKKVTITAGTLSLVLAEENAITISDALPMYDEVGMIQEDVFNFSLINNTSNPTDYVLKISKIASSNELSTSDVKYYLTKNGVGTPALLSTLTDGVIDTGTINGSQTIAYTLRLWIDSSVTSSEAISGKSLSYKLVVDAVDGVANHVIFGGYCWEMVRTTKTGGIKMIYDGTPVEVDGVKTCSNTGTASQLTNTSEFNSNNDDNAAVGYMYGMTGVTTDENRCARLDSDGIAKNYPVAITEEGCTSVGGKLATTAYEATHANMVDSTIKGVIDTWFSTSSLSIQENLKKIEDAVYCNDRSIDLLAGSANGLTGFTTLGYETHKTMYNASARVGLGITNPVPSLECANKNDRFTVSVENGNGDLTYPVGLLSADEIILAGGQSSNNSDYYLYTGESYWAISPYSFSTYSVYFTVASNGMFGPYLRNNLYGVRPVISLASNVSFINGGEGTESNPYVVE